MLIKISLDVTINNHSLLVGAENPGSIQVGKVIVNTGNRGDGLLQSQLQSTRDKVLVARLIVREISVSRSLLLLTLLEKILSTGYLTILLHIQQIVCMLSGDGLNVFQHLL